jgi:hypothetical protein
LLAAAVGVMQVLGGVWNAVDAFQSGNYVSGSVQLGLAILGAGRLVGSLRGAGSAGSAASGGGGVAAGSRSFGTMSSNLLGRGSGTNLIGGFGIGRAIVSGTRFLNNLAGTSTSASNIVRGAIQGALQGGLVGSVMSGVIYGVNWYNIGQGDAWGMIAAVTGGAAGGAITGGLAGGMSRVLASSRMNGLGLFAAYTATGGVSGFVGAGTQSVLTQFLRTGQVNWQQAARDASIGGVIGVGVGALSGGLALLGRAGPMNLGGGVSIQPGSILAVGGRFTISLAGVSAVGVAVAPAVGIAGSNILMMAVPNWGGRATAGQSYPNMLRQREALMNDLRQMIGFDDSGTRSTFDDAVTEIGRAEGFGARGPQISDLPELERLLERAPAGATRDYVQRVVAILQQLEDLQQRMRQIQRFY